MKKILVATDFSPASRYALEYAEWLGMKLGSSLVVLHVRREIKAEDTLDRKKLELLRKRENESARKKLQRFAANYPDTTDPQPAVSSQVRCILQTGPTIEMIVQAAEEEEADLVVVGTRAKHDLLDHLLGSVTTHLIGKIPRPLLIVPEGATYRNINHIAFAKDIELDSQAVALSLQEIARGIGATVQSFYVNILASESRKLKEENIPEKDLMMVRDKTIAQGIEYFLKKHPAEILAMYVPDRALPDRLLHRSLTRQMVYRSPIPLLLFKG